MIDACRQIAIVVGGFVSRWVEFVDVSPQALQGRPEVISILKEHQDRVLTPRSLIRVASTRLSHNLFVFKEGGPLPQYADLAMACLRQDPLTRPTFAQV